MKQTNQLIESAGGDSSLLLSLVAIGTMAGWMIAMGRMVMTIVPMASQSLLDTVRF
jgi:hypothetical protein